MKKEKLSRIPLVVKVAILGEVTPRYHQEGLGAHPEEGVHRPGVGRHPEVADRHRVGEGHHQEAEDRLEVSTRHIREKNLLEEDHLQAVEGPGHRIICHFRWELWIEGSPMISSPEATPWGKDQKCATVVWERDQGAVAIGRENPREEELVGRIVWRRWRQEDNVA